MKAKYYCLNIGSLDANDDVFIENYLKRDSNIKEYAFVTSVTGSKQNNFMVCSTEYSIIRDIKQWAGNIGSYYYRVGSDDIVEIDEEKMTDKAYLSQYLSL